jgi:hypothetical protein
MRTLLLLFLAAGFLLHAYTFAFKAEGGWSLFVIGLFAYSLAPYTAAAVLAIFRPTALAAAGFAAGALLGDLFMHYSIFIAPKGSTAALGLLFMPIWNLLLLGPIGGILAWAGAKLISKRSKANAA